MAVKADPSETPVSCAKPLNDFRGLIYFKAVQVHVVVVQLLGLMLHFGTMILRFSEWSVKIPSVPTAIQSAQKPSNF
jgi:hypothetical protein